mmetsp:Transcript_4542/g.10559  ORF Transcript_4542/g.10559 Transcript_4542/m.10559 type:complete len:222 (+) Transcript_4542:344-1009(+)
MDRIASTIGLCLTGMRASRMCLKKGSLLGGLASWTMRLSIVSPRRLCTILRKGTWPVPSPGIPMAAAMSSCRWCSSAISNARVTTWLPNLSILSRAKCSRTSSRMIFLCCGLPLARSMSTMKLPKPVTLRLTIRPRVHSSSYSAAACTGVAFSMNFWRTFEPTGSRANRRMFPLSACATRVMSVVCEYSTMASATVLAMPAFSMHSSAKCGLAAFRNTFNC